MTSCSRVSVESVMLGAAVPDCEYGEFGNSRPSRIGSLELRVSVLSTRDYT